MKPLTRRTKQADLEYLWHPFTQMQEWTEEEILVIEEAKGSSLKDTEGNWYLDGVSSLWVTVHGHQVPAIDQALHKQLGKMAHSTLLGLTHPPASELARELITLAPRSLKKVFYSDSGSTAVEIALKMAFQYWKHRGEKRHTFIKFENAYHGDTLGSVSVGGMSLFHEIFQPLLFKTIEAPWPHTYWKPSEQTPQAWMQTCLNRLESLLQKHAHQVAACVTEPLIQGASGMATAPKGFLKGVARLCRKYGVLLIVDEVATGFGRTGKMFACEWEKVRPDLLCIAKGLTGGYLPLAATLTSPAIYQAFLGKHESLKTFFHGHTYTGNPLACAAGIANLAEFRRRKTLDRCQGKIKQLSQALKPLKNHPHVGDIRQQGLMVGIELMACPSSMLPFPLEQKVGVQVCHRARNYGVIIRPLGNVIVLMPPLGITIQEIKKLVRAVSLAIQDVTYTSSE